MATQKSSAPAHPSTDDHDERPHACNDGWVTIGQLVADPETGEETEEYALYLCRRCANEAGRKPRPDSPCIHHQRERHRDRAYATANIRLWSLATVASRA